MNFIIIEGVKLIFSLRNNRICVKFDSGKVPCSLFLLIDITELR